MSFVGSAHQGTRSVIVSSRVFWGRLGSLFISGVFTDALVFSSFVRETVPPWGFP